MYYCMFSAATDPAKGTLTCINVKGEDVMSCDNSRATWYTLDSPVDEFMIKAKVGVELKKYEPSHYKVIDSWVLFRTDDGVVFCVRKTSGEYPDISKLFVIEGVEVELPREIVEGLETTSVAYEDVPVWGSSVDITIENGTMELSANRKGILKIKNKIPMPNYDGERISFPITPDFLLEVIKKTPKKENPVMVVDSESKSIYFGNEEFEHVIMMRNEDTRH